jgi:hypothetical protein
MSDIATTVTGLSAGFGPMGPQLRTQQHNKNKDDNAYYGDFDAR